MMLTEGDVPGYALLDTRVTEMTQDNLTTDTR